MCWRWGGEILTDPGRSAKPDLGVNGGFPIIRAHTHRQTQTDTDTDTDIDTGTDTDTDTRHRHMS